VRQGDASDQPTFGGETEPQALAYVPGQFIVRVSDAAVRPFIGGATIYATSDAVGNLPDSLVEPLDFLHREARVHSVTPLFMAAQPQLARAQLKPRERTRLAVALSVANAPEELSGVNVVELPESQVTDALLRKVAASPAIELVERVPARWLVKAEDADPLLNRQWGLRAIRWFQADRPDASEIKVAVADTGIDSSHADFGGIDIDYDPRSLGVRDVWGHGTHVAGIIAAKANNAIGTAGIANCGLSIWKVFGDEPDPTTKRALVDFDQYGEVLRLVAESSAKVLNLSLGGIAASSTEQDLFDRLERFGVTVVAAMGNEFGRGNPTEYPAAYAGVLAVGAVTEAEIRAQYSNTGRHIGLCAPGSNVLSTLPTTRSKQREEVNYGAWSGTSMAAPHVAAVATLLAAQHPDWTPGDIKRRLMETARKIPDMGKDTTTQAYGNGLLDAEASLSLK
jgi:subtilisin family serine protease